MVFPFKHLLSPGAMILPNNQVLKEMEKGKDGGKQVDHRKEPAECSLQIRQNKKASLFDLLVLHPFLWSQFMS